MKRIRQQARIRKWKEDLQLAGVIFLISTVMPLVGFAISILIKLGG